MRVIKTPLRDFATQAEIQFAVEQRGVKLQRIYLAHKSVRGNSRVYQSPTLFQNSTGY